LLWTNADVCEVTEEGQVSKRMGNQGLWGGERGDGKRRLYRLC